MLLLGVAAYTILLGLKLPSDSSSPGMEDPVKSIRGDEGAPADNVLVMEDTTSLVMEDTTSHPIDQRPKSILTWVSAFTTYIAVTVLRTCWPT